MKANSQSKSDKKSLFHKISDIVFRALVVIFIVFGGYYYQVHVMGLKGNLTKIAGELGREKAINEENLKKLDEVAAEIDKLKAEDQRVRNDSLEEEVKNIQETYKKAVGVYDELVDLRAKTKNTTPFDKDFADALTKLSQRDFAKASEILTSLTKKIIDEEVKIAATFSIPQNVPESNAPPGSGYSRQSVGVEGLGNYMVSIVAADLGATRVIVDTASDSDCGNECPVLPLATYVSRNGAYAGINGSYFCPSDYASCAGKTNTFDLLVMNSKKTYFNSDNNVYSNNPVVVFGEGYVRFIGAASGWGRDTSPNGVLSNYPLLLSGGNITFGGDDDPKKGSRGGRSFVANRGNTVYIGVVHSSTVAETARVLKTLGMENALNLDNGGSTALWSGGYKAGPGRNIPNAILFVKK